MKQAIRTVQMCAWSLLLLLAVGSEVAFAQIDPRDCPLGGSPSHCVLFRARSTFATGPATSPADATVYPQANGQPSRIVLFVDFDQQTQKAYIRRTPPGGSSRPPFTPPVDVVIDNFLTINGANACEQVVGQLVPKACFGRIIDHRVPVGRSIETVLTPLPPIDVTRLILSGFRVPVVIELRDWGGIAGNTDLVLHIFTPQQEVSLNDCLAEAQIAFDEDSRACRDAERDCNDSQSGADCKGGFDLCSMQAQDRLTFAGSSTCIRTETGP